MGNPAMLFSVRGRRTFRCAFFFEGDIDNGKAGFFSCRLPSIGDSISVFDARNHYLGLVHCAGLQIVIGRDGSILGRHDMAMVEQCHA